MLDRLGRWSYFLGSLKVVTAWPESGEALAASNLEDLPPALELFEALQMLRSLPEGQRSADYLWHAWEEQAKLLRLQAKLQEEGPVHVLRVEGAESNRAHLNGPYLPNDIFKSKVVFDQICGQGRVLLGPFGLWRLISQVTKETVYQAIQAAPLPPESRWAPATPVDQVSETLTVRLEPLKPTVGLEVLALFAELQRIQRIAPMEQAAYGLFWLFAAKRKELLELLRHSSPSSGGSETNLTWGSKQSGTYHPRLQELLEYKRDLARIERAAEEHRVAQQALLQEDLSRSPKFVIEVEKAGLAEVNGRYFQVGEFQNHAVYRQFQGVYMIYWRGRWKLGRHFNGWIYSMPATDDFSSSPPEGPMTVFGFRNQDPRAGPVVWDVLPPPVLAKLAL
jgi:hypothetical protein